MFIYKLAITLTTLLRYSYGDVLLDGHVTIAGLFQIKTEANGACSDIAPLSVKNVEAVKWVFRKLNENNYINGVTIGLEVWPTCENINIAIDRTLDILQRIRSEKSDLTKSPIVGLIGPAYSSEAQQVSRLLGSQRTEDRLLQVAFSPTATSLSDASVYTNFFRVVPSDATQIEIMISLMKELKWNYVAVIYDEDVYGIEGKDALMAKAAVNSICIAANISLPTGALNLNTLHDILRNIITNVESPISGVVVFTSDTHVQAIVQAATNIRISVADPLSFIFSEAIGLSDTFLKQSDGVIYAAAKGAYIVSPPRYVDLEFEDYWEKMMKNVSHVVQESLSNPWLRDVYRYYSGCLPSSDPASPGCAQLTQSQIVMATEKSIWTSFATKAAFVLAKIIHKTHSSSCNGQPDVCSSMKNTLHTNRGSLLTDMRTNGLNVNFNTDFPFVLASLANISFSFSGASDVTEWLGFPEYEVFQYRKCIQDDSNFCFEKLGAYNSSILTMNKAAIRDYITNSNGDVWPNVNYAQCREGKLCASCISQPTSDKIYFRDGDLILGGIVPVYDAGSTSPLSCGDIRRTQGNEMVQAMEYVIDLVNSKAPPYDQLFPGKSIGALILNSCDQPLLIKQKLLNIFQNGIKSNDGSYEYVENKLLGFVGPYSSSLSLATSEILTEFKYVQTAYASTSIELSDRSKFPYYTRVSTPDNKQVQALISIIRHRLYDSSYIQLVYSEGAYGESGRAAIKEEAEKSNICIIQEIEINDNTNFNIILPTLRNRPFAKVVIIFLQSQQVLAVTTALNQNMKVGEFFFLGSEEWGFQPDAFVDKQRLVGSIVLSLQLPEDKDFTKHLQGITTASKSDNPWLLDYIAAKYNCHIPLSFDKQKTSLCDESLSLASNISYKQEIWTPFALRAAEAFLAGASEAFLEKCGSGSTTLCEQYRINPETLRDKVIQQKIIINGSEFRVFDQNGDGNVGYIIYNLQRNKDNTNLVEYRKVGSFAVDGNNFVFDEGNVVLPEDINLPSVCPNEVECSLCAGPGITVTPLPSNDDDNTTVTALGALVGVLVVLFIVVVIIAVVLYRRIKASDKKNTDAYNYLDVIDENGSSHSYQQQRNGSFNPNLPQRNNSSSSYQPQRNMSSNSFQPQRNNSSQSYQPQRNMSFISDDVNTSLGSQSRQTKQSTSNKSQAHGQPLPAVTDDYLTATYSNPRDQVSDESLTKPKSIDYMTPSDDPIDHFSHGDTSVKQIDSSNRNETYVKQIGSANQNETGVKQVGSSAENSQGTERYVKSSSMNRQNSTPTPISTNLTSIISQPNSYEDPNISYIRMSESPSRQGINTETSGYSTERPPQSHNVEGPPSRHGIDTGSSGYSTERPPQSHNVEGSPRAVYHNEVI